MAAPLMTLPPDYVPAQAELDDAEDEWSHLAQDNGEITLRMYRGKGAVDIHDRVIFGADPDTPLFYVDMNQKTAWHKQAGVDFTLRHLSKQGRPLATVRKSTSKGRTNALNVELVERSDGYNCLLTKAGIMSRSFEFAGPPPDNSRFKWKIYRMRPNYILKRKDNGPPETCAAFVVPDLPSQRDGNFVLSSKYSQHLPMFLATGVAVCLLRQSKEGFTNSPGIGMMGVTSVGGGGGGG
ncbi:hypothetical protein OIO90_004375 [Microbotryomycetes sp. JL221]|nr:hypothetical protein OIO90_004375 [Microbotryomycetes sp. JL221]